MSQDYQELVAFAKSKASDPVGLAKILTAWNWASLLPGGHGPEPTSAQDVPVGLNASCGWRDVLMKALFAEVGIEGRRVNFYDVPYQGGHTATELKIGGKWMFFDATFGLYFEPKGGGAPLSIAEVREQWPAVDVMQCSLPGWQGTFLDPGSLATASYQVNSEPFLYMPTSFAGRDDVIGGEIHSIYLGVDTAYYINGTNIPVASGDFTWQVRNDEAGTAPWQMVNDRYDEGRLDFRHALNDDGSRWFVDYDQGNSFTWASITTYVTERSVFDMRVTVYDDGTRETYDSDHLLEFAWDHKTTYVTAAGTADRQTGAMDDGSAWQIDWDEQGAFQWTSIRDTFDANGTFVARTIIWDDGRTETVTEGPVLAGGAGNDILHGTVWADALRGQDGDDTIHSHGGSDTIDGGAGVDSVVFDGARSAYSVVGDGISGLTVTTADGVSTLSGVERLVFADQVVLPVFSTLVTTDNADAFAWTSATNSYDYLGRTLGVNYVNDDGSTTVYSYDVLTQFAWDRTIAKLDAGGRKVSDHYINDSGTQTVYAYDVAGQYAWSRLTTEIDGANRTTAVSYTNDNGTSVVYQYDVDAAFSWSKVQTDFDSAARRTGVTYTNDDKSQTVYQYDVAKAFAWESVETRFNQAGQRTMIIYNQDDGQHIIYNYESGGSKIASALTYDSNWMLIA